MKRILGLDLGTNSIGWAVVNAYLEDDKKEHLVGIEATGSRIIPMDQGVISDFGKGVSISQTKERTAFRGARRLRQRHLLRRERLNRILKTINWLPEHYSSQLDEYGKFIAGAEPKFAWEITNDGKSHFIFQESFNEMLAEFSSRYPELVAENKKIPYDWTIYYLRKKALTQALSNFELAWLLLNFNQKRGYNQLRDEDIEDNNGKIEEYYSLKVKDVTDAGEKKGKQTWYNIILENDWIYRRTFDIKPDWIGKTKEFIVTTLLEKDGTPKKDKDGNIKRSFRAPGENDWTLLKKRTEADFEKSGYRTIGEYIYNALLNDCSQKIRGKLVRTIERKYYKDEIRLILETQKKFNKDLNDDTLYQECCRVLYKNNEGHIRNIYNRDFTYLFVDDILFYQRPLKSKKSLISDCPYEERVYKKQDSGKLVKAQVKCIAKSNPLFQEFRVWQFISNLKIYEKEKRVDGKLLTDVDVTCDYLHNNTDYSKLFKWLNDKDSVDQKTILRSPVFNIKNTEKFRWNYVEDKSYPCNETRALILKLFKKSSIPSSVLTKELEYEFWHLLYSVEDKAEITKALRTFANKYGFDETFVDVFKKCPSFKKDYGAYSEKAIKKLLPLMRCGEYWSYENIDNGTKDRISKILSGEYDSGIKERVREKAINLTELSHFQHLPLWLACYIVYDRHSEAKDVTKWSCPDDIDAFLGTFKQHSLHNPIVEQVIMETLRTVRDIWQKVGTLNEIHIELGRDMKNSSEKKKKMTKQITDNENTNLRIKALLTEFLNPELGVENVRPTSPSQQEILKIYEDGVFSSVSEVPDDITDIIRKFNEKDVKKRPTSNEVLKYKLWLEQKYCSPYTGQPIPLGKLFTQDYEIEHVIPQARYFDDSLSNKVICEAEVNKLKGALLGYEFIQSHQGEIVDLNYGKTVKILSTEAYEELISEQYRGNPMKKKKLLMTDVPDEFINRQLNDSRYISKVVKTLLSNIVRDKDEIDGISKNVITCTGGITDRLKKDWGVNDVWNKIIISRFQRMNSISGESHFTAFNSNGKEIPAMPLQYQKGFSKKRIDHRHHAMDAIVIACADRNIVNYLNNESAKKGSGIDRYDLQRLVCDKSKVDSHGNYKWIVKKPWETFAVDCHKSIDEIIVSFKQNTRIINKTTNHTVYFSDIKHRKELKEQEKGDSWAIRKPLHKDTVFGEVNLRKIKSISLKEGIESYRSIVDKRLKCEIERLLSEYGDSKKVLKHFKDAEMRFNGKDVAKVDIYFFTKDTKEKYFATRSDVMGLSEYSKDKVCSEIEKITDTGIQKILLKHLAENDSDPSVAFSPDGVDRMNQNMSFLNNGKEHKPIRRVRFCEKSDKFAVGESGNKAKKFVEAAKGTNLFFGVYQSEDSKRNYMTAPLRDVVLRLKDGLTPVPEILENGDRLLFWLSPNDLVYVPTEDEMDNGYVSIPIDKDRIYKMVSSSGKQCFFIKSVVANSIVDKQEFSSLNKMEKALTGEMIKERCIPLKVDRLGNIMEFNGRLI